MNPNEFLKLLQRAPQFANRLERLTTQFGVNSAAQFIQQLTPNDLYHIAAASDTPQSIERQAGEKREKQAVKNVGRFVKLAGALAGAGAFLGSATSLRGGSALTREILDAEEQPQMDRPQLLPPQDRPQLPPTQPTPEPSPGEPPEKKPSLVQQALKGIDIANLEDFQSNRLKPLVKKLESLEGQGKGPDDKTVADLIGRIKKIGGMGVAEQERERFDQAYGQFGDQDENIARQQQDRLQPDRAASRVKDEPGLEVGDLVETKAGKNGRVKEIDLERGIAKIQIDKKVHTKKISDLKKKEWNELKSAVIEEHAYSPDLKTALLKFRNGPWYAYQDVSEDSFETLAKGKGRARTTGQANGFKWWKGKNPSMGAAFWKEIRDKNPYSRLDETIDVDYFFTNFDQISPDLPWQVPAPKKKKRKKR